MVVKQQYRSSYSTMATVHNTGKSVNGKELLVLLIPGVFKAGESMLMWVKNMLGNEAVKTSDLGLMPDVFLSVQKEGGLWGPG